LILLPLHFAHREIWSRYSTVPQRDFLPSDWIFTDDFHQPFLATLWTALGSAASAAIIDAI
jgi:hypothetical protein